MQEVKWWILALFDNNLRALGEFSNKVDSQWTQVAMIRKMNNISSKAIRPVAWAIDASKDEVIEFFSKILEIYSHRSCWLNRAAD